VLAGTESHVAASMPFRSAHFICRSLDCGGLLLPFQEPRSKCAFAHSSLSKRLQPDAAGVASSEPLPTSASPIAKMSLAVRWVYFGSRSRFREGWPVGTLFLGRFPGLGRWFQGLLAIGGQVLGSWNGCPTVIIQHNAQQ